MRSPDRNLGGVSPGWLSPGMRMLFGAQNLRDFVVDGSVVDNVRVEGTG
jgi:hypothetical protein